MTLVTYLFHYRRITWLSRWRRNEAQRRSSRTRKQVQRYNPTNHSVDLETVRRSTRLNPYASFNVGGGRVGGGGGGGGRSRSNRNSRRRGGSDRHHRKKKKKKGRRNNFMRFGSESTLSDSSVWQGVRALRCCVGAFEHWLCLPFCVFAARCTP